MTATSIEKLARTLFATALERKELNEWQSNLRILSDLTRDKVLVDRLENPAVNPDEKVQELTDRLAGADTGIVELLSLLLTNNQLKNTEKIAFEYQRLLDKHRGIEGLDTAYVTTAIPLDNDFILEIGKKITRMTGKPVAVETKVDPGITGGIIIRIGDRLIDGSISSRLAALKKEMSKGLG